MLSNLRFYNNVAPEAIYAPLPDNDSFQQQSLKVIFPNTKIINLRYDDSYKNYNINEIWRVPECPPVSWRGAGVDSDYYRYLRNNLMDSAEKTENHEYIYISRKLNASSPGHPNIEARHIRNEDEMMKALEPLGFKYVLVENMSLEKQMGLFKYAKIIISPHGAALVNACFCTQDTHIIEVSPKECDWVHFSHICETFNIPYTRFNNVYNWDQHYNMEIDIQKITSLVNQIKN